VFGQSLQEFQTRHSVRNDVFVTLESRNSCSRLFADEAILLASAIAELVQPSLYGLNSEI